MEKPTMEVLDKATRYMHKNIDPNELAITMRVLKQLCLNLNYTPKESE
jgi:hypothetical protein